MLLFKWSVFLRLLILTAVLTTPQAVTVVIGAPAVAGGTNPKVIGKTYGEWSADWWNWALRFPTATSPFFAEGNIDCSPGQFGNVWFLAGNFGGVSERTCSIPRGKALFFPILNNIFVSTGETEEEARAAVKAFADGADILECTVDGKSCVFAEPVVRTQSPAFVLVVAPGSLFTDFGLPAGNYFPTVSDGWWVLLPPLPPGEHEVQIHGRNVGAGLEVDVTYHVSVP